MKTIGAFNSRRFGRITVQRATYQGPKGPLAVLLTGEDGEPVTTLSVNMYRPQCSQDSTELPADCFYVKTWSENEEIAREALASGLFIVRRDLPEAESGYVTAPVWQLRSAGGAA